MKLIDSKHRIANVNMFIVSSDGGHSNDVSNDFFGGDLVKVDDLFYCIDQVHDWVNAEGDYHDEDCEQLRLAIINDELYCNY